MKRFIRILAAVAGGLLMLTVPGAPARAQPGKAVQADGEGFIIQAVEQAAKLEQLDMDGPEMADFLKASNACDQMDEKDLDSLPAQTKADLQSVRQRIGQVIHTCQGITAGSQEWYVQTHVADGEDRGTVLSLLREAQEGSEPELIYYKTIRYTDIRNGEDYRQPSRIWVSFPIPDGYEKLVNPGVFTISGGKLVQLQPVEEPAGRFYLGSARTLSSIVVADLPVGLSGISMEKEMGINAGQTATLKAAAIPEGATEEWSLSWRSSDTRIAQVDDQGTVTGVSAGTARITAVVKGREDLTASCKVTVVQGAHSLDGALEEALEETRAYIRSVDTSPTIGSEWNVIGLARGGLSLEDPYFAVYYNHFANYLAENGGKLTNSIKYTEYSKAIVTVTAMGKDARDIGGYNLLENLADFEKVTAQGANGPIWALIALNTRPEYTIPKVAGVAEQTTEEKLLEYVLSQETPAGGWDMLGLSPDPDLTGMAIQALAPYYNKDGYSQVTAAVDRALDILGQKQNQTGGYSTMGVETSESCVQVVTALCALGIDPETDGRFIKGGCWTIENLLTYHIKGSGFMHVKAGAGNNGGGAAGEVNGMATEQGYYAMVAYQRMKQGQTSLYDMSDLDLQKGGKGDGTGTGLTTPSPFPSPSPASEGPSTPGRQNEAAESVSGGSAPASPGGASPLPSGKASLQPSPAAGAVSKNGSGSEKKGGKEKTDDGWNFEAADYEDGQGGWDFPEESPNQEAIEITEGDTQTRKRKIPPLASGIAGGVLGAAALESARYLLGFLKKKALKKV